MEQQNIHLSDQMELSHFLLIHKNLLTLQHLVQNTDFDKGNNMLKKHYKNLKKIYIKVKKACYLEKLLPYQREDFKKIFKISGNWGGGQGVVDYSSSSSSSSRRRVKPHSSRSDPGGPYSSRDIALTVYDM